jgi:hypothetical protein
MKILLWMREGRCGIWNRIITNSFGPGRSLFWGYWWFYGGNQAQSDLNNPNTGSRRDAYGYNYKYAATVFDAFTQFKFSYDKIDFYLHNPSLVRIIKRACTKWNLWNDSVKESTLENFGFKGGILFKISGKQSLNFNGSHLSKAPTIRNTFPNARLNNSVDGLQSEALNSLDATYVFVQN